MNKEIVLDNINDNFPIVEDDFDSLTDYVLFSQIQEKVEELISEVEDKIHNVDIDLSVDGSEITITLTKADGTTKSVTFTVPSKTSDLYNDSGFITKDVNNLTYYYDKTYIDTMIGNIESILETLDIGSGV